MQSTITRVASHAQANEIWLNKGQDYLFYQLTTDSLYYVKDKDGVSSLFPTGVVPPVDSTTLYEAKVSLNSAQIKDLFNTRILIIPSYGVGKAIEIISASERLTFGTVPFDANTQVQLWSDTGLDQQFSDSGQFLERVSSGFGRMVTSGFPSITVVENEDISVGANQISVNGDGSLDIFVSYRVINVL